VKMPARDPAVHACRAGAPPPRAWARFKAFAILFPDLRCLRPMRSTALLYQSPFLAIYERRPGSAAKRDDPAQPRRVR